MDIQAILLALENDLARNKAITSAVNALKELGSVNQAVAEVRAVHADVTSKVEEAKAGLSKVVADAEQVKEEAAEYFRKVKADADSALQEAQLKASDIRAEAVAWAEEHAAEVKVGVAQVRDDLVAEIDHLRGNQAQAQADAAAAEAQLQELQTQVTAAQDRLNAIRNAAKRLSE